MADGGWKRCGVGGGKLGQDATMEEGGGGGGNERLAKQKLFPRIRI